MPAAVQRNAIAPFRHRFTLRQTRRTVPIVFSIELVQASERLSFTGKPRRLTATSRRALRGCWRRHRAPPGQADGRDCATAARLWRRRRAPKPAGAPAALEYASRGIRINAVSWGTIETPIVADMLAKQPDAMKEIMRDQPIGRLGRPRIEGGQQRSLRSPSTQSHRRG